jgi:hypothetical protein
MRNRIIQGLGLFTALSLAVCLVASGIVLDRGSSYAANSLKWTPISIPNAGDLQLYPGSDIGPMAVAPNGATVFAAVKNEGSGNWELLQSNNGAFTWKATGLSDAMAAISDSGEVVAVELSPQWNSDGLMFVATNNSVYYSENSGHTFDDLTAVPGTVYDAGGTDVITSLDLGLDASGDIVVALGTIDPTPAVGGNVYMLDIGGWVSKGVGTYDVLAVGLSPNYDSDAFIGAVLNSGSQTKLGTKYGPAAWDDTTIIRDGNGSDLVSYKACMGFPTDFDPIYPNIFISLSADAPGGDVFLVDSALTVNDLDVGVNGSTSSVNIWSMSVTGNYSNTVIVAGAENVTMTSNGSMLVFASLDGGRNWLPDSKVNKQPTGETRAMVAKASAVTYVGTGGNQSAVSVALNGGYTSWNQRGLIDVSVGEITDMSPSDEYFSDGTMYITTEYSGTASLWRTTSEGMVWERIFCSTLRDPVTGNRSCVFDMVRLGQGVVLVAESGSKAIWRSLDNCVTFSNRKGVVDIGSQLPETISAFAVGSNSSTEYYAGGANGSVSRYSDTGATWTETVGSDIPAADTVANLVITDDDKIYAGTNQGGVYVASTSGFTFVSVDQEESQPGASGDTVCVTPDLYYGAYVYVGIKGGDRRGVWRFDTQGGDEAVWEQIGGATGNISAVVCDEDSGVLYAIDEDLGIGLRLIDPTTTKEDPVFEEINQGLGVGDSVRRDLEMVSAPTLLFAVGGASYTQIWTTSDEIVKMKLIAPEDGPEAGIILEDQALIGRAMVMLQWKEIQGAKRYEVKLAFDEAQDSPVELDYYDGGTPYSNGMNKVVYPWLGTRFYWSVRVVDPYVSQWSEVWSFATPLGPAPSLPELLSPQSGEDNVILRPALQWTSSIAATGYELILCMNCDWANPVLTLSGENAISDTAYQLTFDLAKDTSYCWKVRGVNEITHSLWSDSDTFTTGTTVVVEDSGLPLWVWVIVALATLLMLSILVLIIQSRRY